MILTVFRSRLNSGHTPEYFDLLPEVTSLAVDMPGYLWHKSFIADDGERVTIVEFADQESHQAWANHPQHRAAMVKGRDRFYDFYDIKICAVERASVFESVGPES